VGAGQLKGRDPRVHAGVVQHELFEVDELALAPQCGPGIEEVGAADKTLADRAFGEPFVEPSGGVFGGRERAGECGPGERIGDPVAVACGDHEVREPVIAFPVSRWSMN
jgi:hypothetical protein